MIYKQFRDMAGDFWVIWHPDEPTLRGVGLTEEEARKSLRSRERHLVHYGSIVISDLGSLQVARDTQGDTQGDTDRVGYGPSTSKAVADLVGCEDPQIEFQYGSATCWVAFRGETKASSVYPAHAYNLLQEALAERTDQQILRKIGLTLGYGRQCQETVEQYNQYLDRQKGDTELLIKMYNLLKSSTLDFQDRRPLIEEFREVIKRRTGT